MSRVPAWLYALVALSGAAGLAHELIWVRALGLHFGTSAHAITTVVATFMAGLAAGNWLFGPLADRHHRPFELYQQLELGIAASSLAVSLCLLRAEALLDALARACELAGPLAPVARALGFAALLLGPATLMGGTLPVLARALSRRGHAGSAVGLLYACNTCGAIGGALIPDFASIPELGLTLTSVGAASCNLCVAAGVRWLSSAGRLRAVERESENAAHAVDASLSAEFSSAERTRRSLALLLTGCSGLTALGFEVLWSRTLQHWTGALITSFAVLLAVNLAALALGAAITRGSADRALEPLRAASLLLGSSGCFALLPLATASRWRDLERALWPRAAEVRRTDLWTAAVDALLHAGYLEALPCLLMGASFPFVAAGFVRGERTGMATGQLLTVNTLGGVIGACTAGFLGLPALGQQRSYFAFALLLGAVAAACSALLAGGWPGRVGGAMPLTFALTLAFALPRDALNRAHFRSGAHVIAVREGSTTTAAAALRIAYGQPYYAELLTPGVSMSNTGPNARRYMSLMGHAAMLSAHGDRRALLICYGVGNTAAALLSHSALEHLDVVDISREVLSLAPQFARALGGSPLADPRVRVFVDDGRHHLIVRDERYDVITAEPPPPNHAGVVNLYSREFYRLAKRRLSPGGVISQWLPVFELSDGDVRAAIAAFAAEFPHTALLYGYREHFILLGSQTPLAIDSRRARRAAADPGVAHNLLRSGIGDVDDVLGSVLATDAELRRQTRGSRPVTDDRPSIEYPQERVREDSSYAANLTLDPAHAFSLLDSSADAGMREAAASASRATAAAFSALPWLRLEAKEAVELGSGSELTPALRARPRNAGLWALLALSPDRVRAAEAALRAPGVPDIDAAWTLARRAFYLGEYAQALDRLSALGPEPDERALHALLRAGCLRALGRKQESAAAFREAAAASADKNFKRVALQLAARAGVQYLSDDGPWSRKDPR